MSTLSKAQYYTTTLLGLVCTLIRLATLTIGDVAGYAIHSATFRPIRNNKELLEGRICAYCHVIEKGLSFDKTRIGFGKDKVQTLLSIFRSYACIADARESYAGKFALSTLRSYYLFHENQNDSPSKLLLEIEHTLSSYEKSNLSPSSLTLNKSELLEKARAEYPAFNQSRFSFRNFSQEEVHTQQIVEALEIARDAPSACNRQPTKAYIVEHKSDIDRILTLQGGSNGFKNKVSKLLVIASDQANFQGIQERHLCHVDGGIFAMSTLNALHYKGLGACPLFWADTPSDNRIVKSIIGAKNSEKIVLCIGVGNLPDKVQVARSKKKPVELIYSISNRKQQG